jgi:putative membrane protein insertion efficiency factor
MKKLSLLLIKVYKNTLSFLLKSLFGGGCRYQPTCSEYAAEAITKFGVGKGTRVAVARVLRCHPFAKGGFDPV